MDPLTVEELMTHEKVIEDAKEVGLISFVVKVDFYAKLVAAARASIPRPIADAPRDGTVVERCPHCGYTEEDKRFHMDHHLCDAKNARGPIPKVGAL